MMPRSATSDEGVTLIELLITITVSIIVMGAVGVPLILGLQTTKSSTAKLRESNDAELLSVRLPADLQSVSSAGVDTAPGTGTGCAADSVSPGSTNSIRLQWSENIGGVVNYSASYRTLKTGSEWNLIRVFCSGPTLATAVADTSFVARNLADQTVAANQPALTSSGREITMTLTDTSGYKYSIHGFRRTPT
jgi:hypothetical protein